MNEGYKVTLDAVHQEVKDLRDKDIKEIRDAQIDICHKLDKVNGLPKRVDVLEEAELIRQAEDSVFVKIENMRKETEVRVWSQAKVFATITGAIIAFVVLLVSVYLHYF